ncbi:uncharacterized protein HMPREF1541_05407 [Cyphellophora europaea CBS 101466]|uniref:Uncharacterized protein n=1 Tax=Cyphellophora europaea (strain CBS 101466) TaxID=1220924 RepID=W2RTY4_CYPE1|nr:uncharacterized protein HMPREF1541_05407 [Cyphellophora europaea CBS 101466]ETN39184.1 hypothetical protein HMPREF1541_05407 [Cyphellophora europaea CBS 101466]
MAPPDSKSLVVPIALQIALAVLGFWTLWGFPYNNGLLKHLGAQTEPGASIPGPALAPMKQTYTGIGPVDRQLTVLVSFFYTAIDGNRGDISVAFLSLGSHVIGAWVLITLEGLRAGNKGKLFLVSTTALGLAVAIVGFAVVAPLYFAYQLYSSPTVTIPAGHDLLPADPLSVALIPVGIMIGFGLPSLIMTFPAPSILSYDTKQLWTGIQQGWTFWICLATIAVTIGISALNPQSQVASTEATQIKTTKYLRRAYMFALASTASAHLLPLLICSLATVFPALFAAPYSAQLQLSNVFSLANPVGDLKAATLADGALWFLQWDTFVGVVSVLLWGVTLRFAGTQEETTSGEWVAALLKILAITLAVGPTAMAVISIWARDELTLKQDKTAAVKGNKTL